MLQETWTEERVAVLRKMAERGMMASEIAIKLGVTRMAVLGKGNRLGIKFDHGVKGGVNTARRLGREPKKIVTTIWNEARVTAAAALWKSGLKAKDIAEAMGCSEGAFLALTDRRRDAFPKRGYQKPSAPRKPRVKPVSPIEKIERVNGTFKFDSVPFLLPEFPGVKFIDLEAQHCKFPVSNDAGPDLLCCGANRLEGHPYCGVHLSISRGRGTRSEQMALDGRVWK